MPIQISGFFDELGGQNSQPTTYFCSLKRILLSKTTIFYRDLSITFKVSQCLALENMLTFIVHCEGSSANCHVRIGTSHTTASFA
jgi:hypothetical protein